MLLRRPKEPRRFLQALLALALLVQSPPSVHAAKGFDASSATSRQLISALEDESLKVRQDAIAEIGRRELIMAADNLVTMAKDEESERLRRLSLQALVDVHSSWVNATAERMLLEDVILANRKFALTILEEHGNDRSAKAVARAVTQDSSAAQRRKAALVLRDKGWRGGEEILAKVVLKEKDREVRDAAIDALAILGGEQYRGIFHQVMLEDPEEEVRIQMVQRLEKAPLSIDRDALVVALGDASINVAASAARALIRLGDKSIVPVLKYRALEADGEERATLLRDAAAELGD